MADITARSFDPKRLHHALFGVFYEEDIFEKLCLKAPALMGIFAGRMDKAAVRHNLIFVHVPRVAGTSISHALYGPRCTHHHSIRYYKAIAPRLYARADSFAVLRDPFDRVGSAYAFVRAGGTPVCRLSDVFARQTAHIQSVDDYLSFLESRDTFGLDFVMRPQSWFVCDLESGRPLVKTLFLYGRDDAMLHAYLKPYGVKALARLNPSSRGPLTFTVRQKSRIEKIYHQDFALVEALRRQGAPAHAVRIAAE